MGRVGGTKKELAYLGNKEERGSCAVEWVWRSGLGPDYKDLSKEKNALFILRLMRNDWEASTHKNLKRCPGSLFQPVFSRETEPIKYNGYLEKEDIMRDWTT